jgi:peptide/nickel transport system substrate-binding protein
MDQKAPKSKKKSPKKVLSDLKKPIIGGSLIATFAIAGILGGIFLWTGAIQKRKNILKTSYEGLWYNDTLWDDWYGEFESKSSLTVLYQIAEGLFKYEIKDEYTNIVPNLALNENWTPDGLNLTCQLREDVRFHDGTPFNATAVKWAFDRLQNLLDNMTYSYIWYHLDGKPILNRTEIIDNYIVKFILNRPFGPFKALLCNKDSFILSPSTAPLNDFIRQDTDLLGTGPFKYNSSTYFYNPILLNYCTENTTLVANSEYWDGPPKLKTIVYKYYAQPQDHIKRFEDMVSGKIDYTYLWPWNADNYSVDPRITITCYNTPDIYLIFMKNNIINSTMRKAISYSINYTKMLAFEGARWEGGAIKVRSPLSIGMLYSNWEDFNVPYYNLSFARQILKDVNWNETAGALTANDDITTGNEWENLVNHRTPLAIFNYTYVATSNVMNFYKDLLVENLKQIGVEINLIPAVGGPEGDFWDKLIWSHFLQLGWEPDYNDPTSNINSLFSNKADGFWNWGNVNDSLVQQWMEDGLIESNETIRGQLYYDIQKRLIEEVYPIIWTYSPLYCQVHGPNFRGIDYNLWPYIQLFKDAYFY